MNNGERLELGPNPEVKKNKRVLEIGTKDTPVFIKFNSNSKIQTLLRGEVEYYALNLDSHNAHKIQQLPDIIDKPIPFNLHLHSSIGNGMQIPFADNSFDVVFLSDVLTYRAIPNEQRMNEPAYAFQIAPDIKLEQANQIKLLNECLRVLNADGKLVIADSYPTLVNSAYINSLNYLRALPTVEFKVISLQSTAKGEPASMYEITKKSRL